MYYYFFKDDVVEDGHGPYKGGRGGYNRGGHGRGHYGGGGHGGHPEVEN